MSATVTLHCDRVGHYSACATQVFVSGAATVAQARAAADRHGWHHSAGHDLCPEHCGRPGLWGTQAITTRPTPTTSTQETPRA
ncbi:hypothetical protein RM780_07720 [Streptomyces sp. DSM 44917]|uniref:Uncharacterized protein n=1 Tax=Streptomyces boetiae TaxID=3075541 RepID=A0ABU2L5L3_9ACTN|nr:hypothetical protein [Streptomyces sp. DSM 44917]MDT0306850.1 hypothetical protein [Streptomyces sp. DSM 44917]